MFSLMPNKTEARIINVGGFTHLNKVHDSVIKKKAYDVSLQVTLFDMEIKDKILVTRLKKRCGEVRAMDGNTLFKCKSIEQMHLQSDLQIL